MRYTTISQLGSFTAFTPGTAASWGYLNLDPANCSGGTDAPLRTTDEPIPGADGVYVLPPFDDAQIITLAGTLATVDTDTAIDDALTALKTTLDALKTAPDDLVHSAGTYKVWKYGEIDETWDGITFMAVTFSVIRDVTAE